MARWGRPATPLWSVDIIRERPDIVEEAAADFLKAGADVITLSSYAATPSRLARAGRPMVSTNRARKPITRPASQSGSQDVARIFLEST